MVIYLISRFSNWLFFPRVFLYCFLQPGWCSFRFLHTLNILTYFKYLSGFPTLHGSIGLSPIMFHSINYHLWWCMSCTSLFHLIFHGLYFQRTVSSLHSPRGAGVLWVHFGFASAQAPQTALAMNHSLGPWAELLYHTGCSIWILDQPPHTFVVCVSHQLLFSHVLGEAVSFWPAGWDIVVPVHRRDKSLLHAYWFLFATFGLVFQSLTSGGGVGSSLCSRGLVHIPQFGPQAQESWFLLHFWPLHIFLLA